MYIVTAIRNTLFLYSTVLSFFILIVREVTAVWCVQFENGIGPGFFTFVQTLPNVGNFPEIYFLFSNRYVSLLKSLFFLSKIMESKRLRATENYVYHLDDLLGKGATCEVYKGIHKVKSLGVSFATMTYIF